MAMRLDVGENQVHIVPCYELRLRTINTGGWYSDPELLVGKRPFSGCQKIQRDPGTFLRLMASCDVGEREQLLAICGPILEVEIALTNEESAMMNRSVWMVQRLEAHLEGLATCYGHRKEKRYVVKIFMPAEIVHAAITGIVRCSQERTDENAIGSTPVHTRLDQLFDRGHDCAVYAVPEVTTDATIIAAKAAMHFAAAMFADGRAIISQGNGTLPRYHAPEPAADGVSTQPDPGDTSGLSDPRDAEQQAGDSAQEAGPTGVILEDRLSVAPMRPLRDSVKIEDKDEDQLQYELEKGIKRPHQMPEADGLHVVTHVATVGPPIVDCDAPLDTFNKHNEMNGVARHLAAGTRPDYTDKAKARFLQAADLIEKHILAEFHHDVYYEQAELPQAWGETLKEIVAEEASDPDRRFDLKGMGKSGEIGLPISKRQRLIGIPGPKEAGAQAEFVGLFEKLFKKAYPGFVSKGLTMEEVDTRLKLLLQENKRTGRTLASCDFSAMDSSWYPFEKQRVKNIIDTCIDTLVDKLVQMVCRNDPTDYERIKWKLRTIVVSLAKEDMILFSGERGTSIGNRLLVLILRTAEIILHRGVPSAKAFWDHNRAKAPRTEGDVDFGDGDDTVFDARDYKTPDDIIAAYKNYGKTIEPVISSSALEVLSRYAFLSAKGKFHAMVKVKKNVQRALYAKRVTTKVEDGTVPDLTMKDHLMYATALFQKSIAAKGTPVVRQLILIAGNYQFDCAKRKGATEEAMTQFTDDDVRRRGDALRHEKMDLLKSRAEDAISNADINGFVMEHWLAFSYGTDYKLPGGKIIEARANEWMDCDMSMSEVIATDDDIRSCEEFMNRCNMTKHIALAIGVQNPILLRCCSLGAVPAAIPRTAGDVGRAPCSVATPSKGGGRGSESGARRATNGAPHSRAGRGKARDTKFQVKSSDLRQAVRSNNPGVATGRNTDELANGGGAGVP